MTATSRAFAHGSFASQHLGRDRRLIGVDRDWRCSAVHHAQDSDPGIATAFHTDRNHRAGVDAALVQTCCEALCVGDDFVIRFAEQVDQRLVRFVRIV